MSPSRLLSFGSFAATLMLSACSVTIDGTKNTSPPAHIVVSPEISTKKNASKVRPTASGGFLTERLTASGAMEIGHSEAPLTLILITNPYCDYCREFQQEHVKRLMDDFIGLGLLKLQIVVLPLQKYPASTLASTALLCATKQSKGLAFVDFLFQARPQDPRSIFTQATNAGLETKAFTICLDDPSVKILSEKQATIPKNLDVTLVPTFFLNEEKFVGLPEYAELRGLIQYRLEEAE